MKKIIALVLLTSCFFVGYAQSNMDIIKGVNLQFTRCNYCNFYACRVRNTDCPLL